MNMTLNHDIMKLLHLWNICHHYLSIAIKNWTKKNPTLLSHGEGGQGEAKDKSSINHSSNKISFKLNPQKNTFGNIYYSTW
jgi:hypothetical protein